MTPWKQALTRAITAEVAAEKAATQAEDERRRTWWDTTWALAAVPRAEWGDAQTEYVKRTNHSKSHADTRRRTGERLGETILANGLPQPRFAQAAANWLGTKADEAKVKEAVKLLADAEKNEQSLREFNLALTGKSWTNAPENMTEAEEDAVVEKVARIRPRVVARQTAQPAVAKAVVHDPQATKAVIQQQSAKTQRVIQKRKAALAQNPTAAAQTAAAVDAVAAAEGNMSNSPEFTAMRRAWAEFVRSWHRGVKEQSFTPFDRHLMGAELPAKERFMEEHRSFVEAEDDPYEAVAQVQTAEHDQFNREYDEAEAGIDFDSGLEEIERYANEAETL